MSTGATLYPSYVRQPRTAQSSVSGNACRRLTLGHAIITCSAGASGGLRPLPRRTTRCACRRAAWWRGCACTVLTAAPRSTPTPTRWSWRWRPTGAVRWRRPWWRGGSTCMRRGCPRWGAVGCQRLSSMSPKLIHHFQSRVCSLLLPAVKLTRTYTSIIRLPVHVVSNAWCPGEAAAACGPRLPPLAAAAGAGGPGAARDTPGAQEDPDGPQHAQVGNHLLGSHCSRQVLLALHQALSPSVPTH